MEKDERWETFALSGKVEDYLNYRQVTGDAAFRADSSKKVDDNAKPGDMVEKHAGFY